MTRRHRSLAALGAGIALVFAQFAVSAHACVLHGQPAPVEVIAHHDGCPGGMDEPQAPTSDNVCAAHCQYGKATFDNTPQVPAAVDSLGPGLRIEISAAAASADSRPAWRFVPAAAPPPPAILFGVLRI